MEVVKTIFTLEDLKDKELIIPCNDCNYVNDYPVCSDGATSSACNHCAFAILDNIYNKKTLDK